MPNPHSLLGKKAFVTGGKRRIGRGIALAFAEAGADVIIASRKIESCEELAVEVRERFGRKAMAIACNVSNWDAMDELANAAYAKFGRVDILVNNGLYLRYNRINQSHDFSY